MAFEAGDVVVVPFPCTDRTASKRRPALIISDTMSFGDSRHSVLAMITRANRSLSLIGVAIADQTIAGLPAPCVVRMKLFTLDSRLIERRAGTLGNDDAARVADAPPPLIGIRAA